MRPASTRRKSLSWDRRESVYCEGCHFCQRGSPAESFDLSTSNLRCDGSNRPRNWLFDLGLRLEKASRFQTYLRSVPWTVHSSIKFLPSVLVPFLSGYSGSSLLIGKNCARPPPRITSIPSPKSNSTSCRAISRHPSSIACSGSSLLFSQFLSGKCA